MRKNILLCIIVILLFTSCDFDVQLKEKMLNMYSDDQSYVTLHGEVLESNDNTLVIECENLKSYITYEDEFCEYYVYSEEIINLVQGTPITFITVPFHFYNGHKLPIVELVVDEEELLEFAEGKERLISSLLEES